MRFLVLVCAPAALFAQTLTVSPATLGSFTRGVPVSQTFTASGGSGSYAFSATGTLPTGLTLTVDTLSGTPSGTGNYTFTIQVSSGAQTGSRSYTVTVNAANIVLGPLSLSEGKVGQAYSQTLTASGAPGPFTFALLTGAFPAGVTLSSAGVLSGTPAAAGPFSFTIRASDSFGNAGTKTYSLTVAATLTISPATVASPVAGLAYTQTLTVTGGIAPYTWSVGSDPLPAGLTLSSSGLITGIAATPGQYVFTVVVIDSAANNGTRSYNVSVLAQITIAPATLPSASVSKAYTQTLSAAGGMWPYTYALTQGTLPTGFTLTSAGVLSGTAGINALGTYTITVTATDFTGRTGSQTMTLSVVPLTLSISPDTLPDAAVGQSYTQVFTASGGVAPYTFSYLNGPLPDGLTISPTGTLSGTPLTGGRYTVTIQAVDSLGRNGIQEYDLFIRADMTLLPEQLPGAVAGVPYVAQLRVSGGAAPYSYFIQSGALPQGLGMDFAGRISGTPQTAGKWTFTVNASDANGSRTTRTYTIAVSADLAFVTTTLPDAKEGSAYRTVLTATGGQAPYIFSLELGTLPAGLSLSSSGILSGTPSANGAFALVFRVTDAQGGSLTQSLMLTIAPTSAAAPRLIAEPAALIARVRLGGVPGPLCLSVFSTSGAPSLSAVLQPVVGWAALLTQAATAPANLCLALQTTGLGAGEYRTSLLVNGTLSAPVILIVEAATASAIRVMPPSWTTIVPRGTRTVSRPVTVVASDAAAATATVDATGMAAGVYTKETAVGQAKMNVTLVVSEQDSVVAPASQTVELRGIEGGASPPAQRVALPYIGAAGSLTVMADSGADWLRWAMSGAGPTSVAVWADIRGLAEGSYGALLKLGTQFVPVNLTVLPPYATPTVPMPALVLAGTGAANTPLTNLRTEPVNWNSLAVTSDGAAWLHPTTSGSLPSGAPGSVAVTAQPGASIPRPARGAVRFGLGDGSTRSLPVVFAESCADASGPLLAQILQPAAGQSFPVGQNVTVQVGVRDCKGAAVDNAGVTVQAGADVLDLVRTEPGTYAATWTPGEAGVVQLEAFASSSGTQVGRHTIDVLIQASTAGAPHLTAAVHGASFRPAVAPGTWLSLYGTRLEATRLRAADKSAYISFAGPSQMNALLPLSLTGPDLIPMAAQRGNVWSAPLAVPLQSAAPGVFTTNMQGTGQAAALISGTANLAAPATRGQVIEVYCSGLGAVTNVPADGVPAPSSPFSQVRGSVTATVGGVNARVLFSGLTPGFLGLYQVNVQIPANAPTGAAVPLVLNVGGVASPETTIGVQ